MQKRSLKIFVVLAAAILMMCGMAYAGSQTTDPTAVLTDTTTPAATQINNFKVTELGNTGFGDGYFRLVIPSSVGLARTISTGNSTGGDSITRSTSVLGTAAAPNPLYLNDISATSGAVCFIANGSYYGLMVTYNSPSSNMAVYGSAEKIGSYVKMAKWSGLGEVGKRTGSGTTSAKIGEIYYNDTTQETVITLAGIDSSTGSSEEIWFNGMWLKPSTASSTGTVNLSTLDKDANGNNGIGITDDTGVKVMTMTSQPAYVEGKASTETTPTIPAGKVAGQPIGRIKATFVGDATGSDNKLTIALNNGAKFHSGSTGTTLLGGTTSGKAITVNGTAWQTWASSSGNASLSVNSSGELVIALGQTDISNAQALILPAQTGAIIDTSGVTASSAITATVTGSGADLTGLSQSVLVANASVTGTTVSFSDDTTSGYTKIYAGRTAQTIGESLLIGEDAPESLLKGGTISVALNQGAKFTKSDTWTTTEYTTSPYGDSSLALSFDAISSSAAQSSHSGSVTAASITKRGAYKVGGFSFDLSSATAGDMTMTVSGNAGASGTITMATIINATSTTVSETMTIVPGSSGTVLPDIVITENNYGALQTGSSKDIILHFPSTVTLDATASVTITSKSATSGSSSTTAVVKESVGTNDLYLDVATASAKAGGAYTVTISGLTASIASNASSGNMSFTITGTDNSTYGSGNQGSNYGAMPTAQTVTFGSVVSSTIPYAGTATVSGTAVTQTFIAAGNDIGKVGDVYLFTSKGKYWTGSAWTATETALSAGTTLGTHTLNYDTDGLATGSKIYIGYGVGLKNTATTMSTNGTFVLAYTTAATTDTGKDPGGITVDKNLDDDIALYLNITNDDGYDPATDFAYEWLVFGFIIGGVDQGLWFFDSSGNITAYTAALDMTTVTYAFDHTSDTVDIGVTLNMGTLGLAAGDSFWYGYVYGLTGFDIADTTTWFLENYSVITAN